METWPIPENGFSKVGFSFSKNSANGNLAEVSSAVHHRRLLLAIGRSGLSVTPALDLRPELAADRRTLGIVLTGALTLTTCSRRAHGSSQHHLAQYTARILSRRGLVQPDDCNLDRSR